MYAEPGTYRISAPPWRSARAPCRRSPKDRSSDPQGSDMRRRHANCAKARGRSREPSHPVESSYPLSKVLSADRAEALRNAHLVCERPLAVNAGVVQRAVFGCLFFRHAVFRLDRLQRTLPGVLEAVFGKVFRRDVAVTRAVDLEHVGADLIDPVFEFRRRVERLADTRQLLVLFDLFGRERFRQLVFLHPRDSRERLRRVFDLFGEQLHEIVNLLFGGGVLNGERDGHCFVLSSWSLKHRPAIPGAASGAAKYFAAAPST